MTQHGGLFSDALAKERLRTKRLNIPDGARDRTVRKYMSDGLTELQALQKLNDDIVRDRARYRG